MIKYILNLLLGFIGCSSIFAGNVQAYLSTCNFNVPGKTPYVESYLSIVGNSIVYNRMENGKYQGIIEVTIIVKKDTQIISKKTYNLLSPEVNDTSKALNNFIDQQRMYLSNGSYKLSLIIKDLNNTQKPYNTDINLAVGFPVKLPSFSDIELVENFTKSTKQNILTKNDYDVMPNISNFYPKSISNIKFYVELYNINDVISDEKFLLKYYIEKATSKNMTGNLSNFMKLKTEAINIVMAEIPIDSLPSGNYNLVVEARNKSDELIVQKKVFFQRSNIIIDHKNGTEHIAMPLDTNYYNGVFIENTFVSRYNNKDTLAEMINCLFPISGQFEQEFMDNTIQKGSLNLMKQYFYDFWDKRNHDNPYLGWLKYRDEVLKVNLQFSNALHKGYDTDRGRVYLHYGEPNIISPVVNDDASLPYEIWHYYKLKDQSDRKFVFYEPNEGNREYILLHSNVKGEISNVRWLNDLHKRNVNTVDLDQTGAVNDSDARALELYNHPK